MKRICTFIFLISFFVLPVYATEFTAPMVPDSALEYMPNTDSFGQGMQELLGRVLPLLRPDLAEAAQVSMALIGISILVGLICAMSTSLSNIQEFAGAAAISAALLGSTNSLIHLASNIIIDISEYGKLLLQIMASTFAAQGGVTASAALYTGTAAFASLLGKLISGIFLPVVYFYLAVSASYGALGEEGLKRIRDMLKNSVSWCLKTILTIFVTYIGITGVVSGTTDAAALKAAKVSFSTFVPVVGSILSDASEAVLVSAGLAKNAAGIYGILAMLAIFLRPFLKIGVHYLVLKLTTIIVAFIGTKRTAELISDFSGAMGLLLGMTGSMCLLQLIGTVCFMKGVG